MPTTPNPTPPTAEPGTGDDTPAPPVYDTTKPDMLGMYAEALKTSIGYVDHDYTSGRHRSPYYSSPAVVSVPGIAVFDGVCPGRWSRRYYNVQDAAALTGGSGYFGYDTSDLNSWWSTNFRDDGDAGSYMVKSPGTYYSKNVTVTDDTVLMGAITVEGSTVKLKWGSSWGTVTRNACFDYLDSTYNYVYQSTTIPRQTDGKVDVTQLNLSVMKYAPGRGCFVMFDLASNQVLYTMLDGEQEQLSWSPSAGATIPALQSRDATDPGSLPLTSKLTALPTFAPVMYDFPAGKLNSSLSVTKNMSTATIDRQHTWLKAFRYMDSFTDNTSTTTLAAAQASTASGALFYTDGNFYGKVEGNTGGDGRTGYERVDYDVSIYSGWLYPGTPYQCVGYVAPSPRSISSVGGTLWVTPYGMTSKSPTATVQGATSVLLTTPNTRDEILSRCPSVQRIAFILDLSVGSYGQLSWLSQL